MTLEEFLKDTLQNIHRSSYDAVYDVVEALKLKLNEEQILDLATIVSQFRRNELTLEQSGEKIFKYFVKRAKYV